MTNEKKKEISDKIEDLKKLAKETNSPLLLFMKENGEINGRHLAAFGSGLAIRILIIDAANHNENLREILKSVKNEAFPDYSDTEADGIVFCGRCGKMK